MAVVLALDAAALPRARLTPRPRPADMAAEAKAAAGTAAADDPADGVAAPPRVLSVQSHVVSGYVGNKVATFPLQLFGYEVDVLNTVQLSNHTGYAKFGGQRLSTKDIDDLLAGLEVNRLDAWSHVLTGYVGSADLLRAIAVTVRKLKASQASSFYVCDPVMGDLGRLYVPETVVPVYRDELLPLADVITPNQFEAEILTGLTIRTVHDLVVAADRLHALGPRYVVTTSSVLDEDGDGTTSIASMTLMASTARHPQRNAAPSTARGKGNSAVDRYVIRFPKLEGYFSGTGDLFAALLLGRLHEELVSLNADDGGAALARACEKVLATMQVVLKRTAAKERRYLTETYMLQAEGKPPSDRMRHCELQLIASRDAIENPPPLQYTAVRVTDK